MMQKVWFRTGEPSEVSLEGSPLVERSMPDDSEPTVWGG